VWWNMWCTRTSWRSGAQDARTDADGSGTRIDTVWNAIRRIFETIKEIEEDVVKGTDKMVACDSETNAVSLKLDTLNKNFHGLKTFAQENLSKIAQKIRAVENKKMGGTTGVSSSAEYKRLLDRMGIINEVLEQHTRNMGRGDITVMRLDGEVENLKRKFKVMDLATTYDLTNDNNDLKNRVWALEDRSATSGSTDCLEDKCGALEDNIERLTDRMDKSEAGGIEESFQMEDFAFSSYGDFARTVLSERIPSCGIPCFDAP
jgi:uncharacterized protein YukE